MKDCRHSVLETDFGFVIRLIKSEFKKLNENSDFRFQQMSDGIVDGKPVRVFQIIFPKDIKYYGHKLYVHICKNLNLPLKFVVYDINNKLLEDYEFWDLKVNVGLTEMDFDIKNPKYKF